jgi:hypothetical protein
MLKQVGVFVMALASLGALVPATAAAAERGRVEAKTVVMRKKIVRRHHRKAHRVFVNRIARRKSVR